MSDASQLGSADTRGRAASILSEGARYEAWPGDPGVVTATRVDSGEELWRVELVPVKTEPSLKVTGGLIEVDLAGIPWVELDRATGGAANREGENPLELHHHLKHVRDLVEMGGHHTANSNDVRAAAKGYLRDMHLRRLAAVARFRDFETSRHLARKRALFSGSPEADEEAATVRGERFERYVAKVLSAEWRGFECQHLGQYKQTERGIDLLFVGPNGELRGVQCKQHAEARVPSYQEWQSFLGGCTFHQIPDGSRVFVTTGTLSIRQQQEARKLGVIVFYKDELAQIAEEHGIEAWS